MTRRMMLLLPLAACLRADSAKEVVDLITDAATGLSAGRAEVFLEALDPGMPGYAKFRETIVALVRQADLECSIEMTGNEGDDATRTLELDWILRINARDGAIGSDHRQANVKCRLRKSGKKWRIVEIEPREFFAPPK